MGAHVQRQHGLLLQVLLQRCAVPLRTSKSVSRRTNSCVCTVEEGKKKGDCSPCMQELTLLLCADAEHATSPQKKCDELILVTWS